MEGGLKRRNPKENLRREEMRGKILKIRSPSIPKNEAKEYIYRGIWSGKEVIKRILIMGTSTCRVRHLDLYQRCFLMLSALRDVRKNAISLNSDLRLT